MLACLLRVPYPPLESKFSAPDGKKMLKNPALGAYEASCVLGVHWTRVPKMANAGILTARTLTSSRGTKRIRVYSFENCQENWQSYVDELRSGDRGKRERSHADKRPEMLKALKAVEHHVDFYDAVGIYEAAEILGVWYTFLSRLVERGDVVGRKLISFRESTTRAWIYSRRSCEENVEVARRLSAQHVKTGRPRSGL
jgi:hypothetical protein